MADNESLLSPTYKFRKSSSSSIFSSPRLFTGFTLKDCTDTESIRSPTSVFDSKPFSAVKAPLCSDNSNSPRTSKPESRIHLDKLYSKGVGLGLVDALIDETSDPILSKTKSRMVLFGSQLKIQIPQLLVSVISSASDYRKSPEDFGIKPQNYQPVVSPNSSNISPFGSLNSGLEIFKSPQTSSLSAGEMELLEEYTCVITHGPNPKTIHIFDDCIIESCCGIVGSSTSSKKDNGFGTDKSFHYPSESFLSSCYNCKKNLGEGKDIYMYSFRSSYAPRGEKAFCSSECRCKEIISDDGIQKSDDTYQSFL